MSDFKFSTEPFLDSDQAAAILRIHPKTLQRLARHGRVIGYPAEARRWRTQQNSGVLCSSCG
jgi:hypothetical protein